MSEFFEVARGPRIEAVEQLLVRPFEIEDEVRARREREILEILSRRVVDEVALRAGRPVVRQRGLDQATFFDSGNVVARRPADAREFLAEIEVAGFQRFRASMLRSR